MLLKQVCYFCKILAVDPIHYCLYKHPCLTFFIFLPSNFPWLPTILTPQHIRFCFWSLWIPFFSFLLSLNVFEHIVYSSKLPPLYALLIPFSTRWNLGKIYEEMCQVGKIIRVMPSLVFIFLMLQVSLRYRVLTKSLMDSGLSVELSWKWRSKLSGSNGGTENLDE